MPREVAAMVALHGLDLFRDSVPNRMLCCDIRKVAPAGTRPERRRGLSSPDCAARRRNRAPSIEVFDRSGASVKISPLADWTTEDVVRYTHEHGLPEHPLYAAGYTSIGCDPCTRAVVAGEDERAGRWWWESPEAVKECGLHFSADGRAERTVDVLLREVLRRASQPRMTHEGFTVWLTGMSGAGKSTHLRAADRALRDAGRESGTARWRYRAHQSLAGPRLQPRRSRHEYPAHRFRRPNCSRATASSWSWPQSLLIARRARK